MFLHSFHDLSERDYWSELRKSLRPDLLAKMDFDIDNATGRVSLRTYALSQAHFDVAGPRVRQFLTGADEVSLDKVLHAARNLGLGEVSEHVDEAQHQWDQLLDRRFVFYARDGRTLGLRLAPGKSVGWDPALTASSVEPAAVSLRDTVEVALYEGHIHPFEPGKRNAKQRALVRSIPEQLRGPMANLAVAVTAYAAMILHGEVSRHLPALACDAGCQVQRILRSIAAN